MPTKAKKPIDHLSKKQPVRQSVYLAAEPEMLDAVNSLEAEVRRLRLAVELRSEPGNAERLPLAESELEHLKNKLDEDAVRFTFKAMGREAYDKLVQEHPPTEAQLEEVRKEDPNGSLPFNPESFPLALIMGSMEYPDVSDPADANDVREWLRGDAVNQAEFMSLFQTCVTVNNRSTLVQVGKGSRQTNGFA